jgi:hypothetical protein
MKLGLFTADGLKVLAVLSVVGIFGYVMYHVATDQPDRWQSSTLDIDEDLANSHCNVNYQCEDDLKVALAGCLAVHRHDEYARDAMYGCQYDYMAKLEIRRPVRGKDGQWTSGNWDELNARAALPPPPPR